jgi:hypothetical protein
MLKWIKKRWKLWKKRNEPCSCVGQSVIILDEFAKVDKFPRKEYLYPPTPADPWKSVDSRLPRICPMCKSNTVPSKIDDRMVACLQCTQVFMSQEAYEDPNIQRDITHAQAGISTSQTPMRQVIKDDKLGQSVMDELRRRRDNEIRDARMFGEGYTRGKYGMSRKEFNGCKKNNECNDCEGNDEKND